MYTDQHFADIQHGVCVRGHQTRPLAIRLRHDAGGDGDETVALVEAVEYAVKLLVGIELVAVGADSHALRDPARQCMQVNVLEQ